MDQMADLIEQGHDPMEIIRDFFKSHQRIIFNGDGYSKEWEEEAKRRGLPNNRNTVEALKCLKDSKNLEMLRRQDVYSEVELKARHEILKDSYIKTIQLEGLTALIKWLKHSFILRFVIIWLNFLQKLYQSKMQI